MPEFISKLRVAVRIRQTGEEPVDGFLLLLPQAEFHRGPETILERLNATDRLIPFVRRSDGATLLVGRPELEWVAAARTVAAGLVLQQSHFVTHEERVAVRFRSGEEMEGLIQMELPEMLNRASDFLNGSDDFFALLTSAGTFLVNKGQVLHTRLFEASPLPIAPESGESGY
ncbi:MAG: hypothetical protein E6K78_10560 [Candidatus Eisenbacteria bacterium]|uniref:Uncharacterized protein n=1 Tax=Eiseniibacteriota bacterium TaxID=2212470 RepID=A0A538TIQ4_UNCEI|nr:MAG: hypothetical protein E6K78_10560 [Candidatus Eisenbacteria bacterium]